MSEERQRQPWDQLPEESKASYARFLTYRNLGRGRSVEKAYAQDSEKEKGSKRLTSGLWYRESRANQWVDRAHAWDVAQLERQGEQTAVTYVAALQRYVEALYEGMGLLKPKSFNDATEALKLLGSLLPGSALGNLINSYRNGPQPEPEQEPGGGNQLDSPTGAADDGPDESG